MEDLCLTFTVADEAFGANTEESGCGCCGVFFIVIIVFVFVVVAVVVFD